MKKQKRFHSPGIYHDLLVKVVTPQYLAKLAKDKNTLAMYDHDDGEVYVSKGLKAQPRIHCFYHELAHHIIETLSEVEEETRCDVLGAYLMRLSAKYAEITKTLNEDIEDDEG